MGKNLDKFTKKEIFEMGQYVLREVGNIYVCIGTNRDTWDQIQLRYINYPDNTLHLFGSRDIPMDERDKWEVKGLNVKYGNISFSNFNKMSDKNIKFMIKEHGFGNLLRDITTHILDQFRESVNEPGSIDNLIITNGLPTSKDERKSKVKELFRMGESYSKEVFVKSDWIYTLQDIYKSIKSTRTS